MRILAALTNRFGSFSSYKEKLKLKQGLGFKGRCQKYLLWGGVGPQTLFFSPLSQNFLIEGVLGSKTFQTLLAILGPPSGHFGFCRRCGVVSGGRVVAPGATRLVF